MTASRSVMSTTQEAAEPRIYRGRLAPSPTGLLHLGHVRTFVAARDRARSAGGRLLLHIDDLDRARSREEYMHALIQDLQWLGLKWDGAPTLQSSRMPLYRAAWERLTSAGLLYPCACSRRDLAAAAGAPHGEDEPVYPGTCRPPGLPAQAERARLLARGPDGTHWRFRVPQGERIRWLDGGRGPREFTAGQHFGDFSVWRRDGIPAYQLASVADDVAMGITEVVRGADLLISAARQILLMHALDAASPAWFHCALVLDEHGARLAKRSDGLSVRALRRAGFTPEQVIARARQADAL